jgi:hypothetical protein
MKLAHALSASITLASATLIFACGGQSTNPAGASSPSNDGGDKPSTPTNDGGGDDGGASCTVATGCGSAGDVCCFTTASTTGQCVAKSACAGVTVSAGCTTSASCGSQVCCASFAGGALSSSCADSCSGTSAQLCGSSTECPSGDSCQTANGYGICLPNSFGLDGGFPSFDAGSFFNDGGGEGD